MPGHIHSLHNYLTFLQFLYCDFYHIHIYLICDEIKGVIAVSYPIDKLVEWIIENKENLQKYKDRSKVNMNILKEIIGKYPKSDQIAIMTYMNSNGRFRPTQLIDRLCEDIFERTNQKRGQRFKEQERKRILSIMSMRKPINTMNKTKGAWLLLLHDIATVKKNIEEYRKNKRQSNIEVVDTSIEDFFSLDTNVTDEVQSLNVENHVYINNLIDEVNLIATDREFSVFWLIISGRELNDIAKIFNLTVQRIRQIFDETIEKLFY